MPRSIIRAIAVLAAFIAVPAAIAGPTSTTAPKLVGTVAFDQTVTCDPGTFSPAPASISYAWSLSGGPVPGATTNKLAIDKPYYMGGYNLSCVVTATDATGQTTTVSSPAVVPGLGATTLKITSVKVKKRGAFVIKGQVGPKELISGRISTSTRFLDAAGVVLDRKLPGGKAVTQLSSSTAPVDSHGRFTITGHDAAGKRKVIVSFFCGSSCFGLWAPVKATRTVKVTPGFSGGITVGIH